MVEILGNAHLKVQKDVDLGVFKLVDHLSNPGVVQEVYVLKPACTSLVESACPLVARPREPPK